MENPCKLIFFGDSIVKEYTPKIEKILKNKYPEIEFTIINAGISGETSRDGLLRIQELLDKKPNVIVIGFGMNDWRKGVDKNEYNLNLTKMVDLFENIGTRVILTTVSPSYNFDNKKYNNKVDEYSEVIREIAYKKRIKIADINALWKREISPVQNGLRDELHPNKKGYDSICESLMYVIPRRNTTILWQYNSREAKCNYRCPYCYYIGLHSPVDKFHGKIEQWHEAFLNSFGKQHIYFYMAFGEPIIGKNFFEILDMVGNEPNWEGRITSNISILEYLKRIVNSKAAKEGRFHINGSFHPCMTTREKFLNKLLFLRDNGIEPSIVYVAYPKYFSHFVEDIEEFSKHGFITHVRTFQGKYKGKLYPQSYTEEEYKIVSFFMDSGSIKYMLNLYDTKNHYTFSGFHFFIINETGKVGYDSNCFRGKYKGIFGNILDGSFKPPLLPTRYPCPLERTVDGVANIIDAGYKELEGNHVIHFAKQGGVYKNSEGEVIFKNG